MKKKDKIYIGLIAIVLVVILIVVVVGIQSEKSGKQETTVSQSKDPLVLVDVQEIEKIVEVEKLVEIEKVISAGILEDGLREMGILITAEYYFTDVLQYTSQKEFPWIKVTIPFTESRYLVSYDGVVTAGIDFSKIKVEKDDENKIVIVYLPAAEIRNVDIDPNSMVLYSEKTSVANPVSVTDYNESLVALESSVKDKAIERGLLTNADENAKKVITNFVGSLVDTSVYRVRVEAIA